MMVGCGMQRIASIQKVSHNENIVLHEGIIDEIYQHVDH